MATVYYEEPEVVIKLHFKKDVNFFKLNIMKTNRQIFSLLFVSFAVAIFSCDGDDDKKTITVVGTWKEISTETIDCPNATDNRLDECEPTNTCDTWQFNAEGTHTRTTSTNIVVQGTYIMMGNQIQLCYPGCLTYDLSISGPVLTITEVTTPNDCVTQYKLSRL